MFSYVDRINQMKLLKAKMSFTNVQERLDGQGSLREKDLEILFK